MKRGFASFVGGGERNSRRRGVLSVKRGHYKQRNNSCFGNWGCTIFPSRPPHFFEPTDTHKISLPRDSYRLTRRTVEIDETNLRRQICVDVFSWQGTCGDSFTFYASRREKSALLARLAGRSWQWPTEIVSPPWEESREKQREREREKERRERDAMGSCRACTWRNTPETHSRQSQNSGGPLPAEWSSPSTIAIALYSSATRSPLTLADDMP